MRVRIGLGSKQVSVDEKADFEGEREESWDR